MSDQTTPAPADQPPAETTPPPPPAAPAPANPWAAPGSPDPWADYVASQLPPVEPASPSRIRGTLLRWAAVALVLGLSGSAMAYAVAQPERTRIPGLSTPNDGRYVFPPLTLPQLPAGQLPPQSVDADQRHYADLRALVLPAPEGAVTEGAATATPTASATPTATPASWVPCADYTKLHEDSAHLPVLLATDACRSATTRSWTAKDGTRTEIWLLRFGSKEEGGHFYDALSMSGSPKAVPSAATGVNNFDLGLGARTFSRGSAKTGPGTDLPTAQVVYLGDGDVVATVLMTNPAGVPSQALHQVVTLQSDLLG